MSSARLDKLLSAAASLGASDLHLIAGVPPAYRVNGEIILADEDALTAGEITPVAFGLLNELQRDKFEREWELCISLLHSSVGRIRATFYKRNGYPEMSFRFCGDRIALREELGLPAKIDEMTRKPNGLLASAPRSLSVSLCTTSFITIMWTVARSRARTASLSSLPPRPTPCETSKTYFFARMAQRSKWSALMPSWR